MKEIQNKINKKEISEKLDIEIRTLYNWEKTRPKLYNFIVNSINKENERNSKLEELQKLYENLTDLEKEYYLSEMKTKILKRKLKENE
ncbi:TetR/AcrR family transcriptional regulator [Campylobacter sp. CNRCH_2013_0671h]|uniref:TetR/AcrR family transcriptional regulator n=1 Tax=Campylobacter TaxID=194 RepID=UPI001FB83B9E|nr:MULTISPECIES: TetR/AcrR family transcriptional regulator [Campylobacter]MCV3394269.1 TetR/AcrR family transcriptional regulator [Campylobacter sp. IFREMER_LSEM_CL908]MCV3548415.1 TetR/AcrR family transcriptional regulator [Campylobacter sp. CNRCH_2013_0671h]MCW0185596.1 TetR/AcrR family transcriptional regulator [Campylobacter lari]